MYLAKIIEFLTFLPEDIMFKLCPIKKEIQILGFNSIYYFEFGKNFTHTPEKHNFWEMVYVDSGKIIAVTNGAGTRLVQGQAIFHEPMELHSHISDMEVPNNMLVVSFTSESSDMSFFSNKTFTLDKEAKVLLSLFIAEANNALGKIPWKYSDKRSLDFSRAKFGSMQLLDCYFTELLIRLFRSGNTMSEKISYNKETRAIAQNSIVEMLIDYLKENVYASLSLNDICSHFMHGKSQLCSIFKNSTGKSIMAYYRDEKIKEAKNLLRNEEYSIYHISELLCYSGIHTFSRAFKNAVGFSPTEYRHIVFTQLK